MKLPSNTVAEPSLGADGAGVVAEVVRRVGNINGG